MFPPHLHFAGTWFQQGGMSTGLVSFLNTTIIFDIAPRPEGATEMPYTKFRVGFGFNAVGAIGHRKLADGISERQLFSAMKILSEKVLVYSEL